MFKRKSNSKFRQQIIASVFCAACLISGALAPQAKAHEMWIEPVDYALANGSTLRANEIVGQRFKGNKYPYVNNSYKSLNVNVGGTTKPIKARMGDMPAIQQATTQTGLHIITAQTTPSELVYKTADKFAQFLAEEGLHWISAEHKRRGLPEYGFKENYWRNAKALVKVGTGKGKDQAFGLPFEWVLLTNPYTSDGAIRAQLLWQGKPLANHPVNVFNKATTTTPRAQISKHSDQTDAEGIVTIPRGTGGLFLLNAVTMRPASAAMTAQNKAVWESIWTSVSYAILSENN